MTTPRSPTRGLDLAVVVGAERDDDLVGPDREQLGVVDHAANATGSMPAMTVERIEPAFLLPEREMLEAWLDYHRATLAVKCDGLSDAQLRERSVPPSSMSLLGLVRHMADVERNWFRRVLSAEDAPGIYYDRRQPRRRLRRRRRRVGRGGVRRRGGPSATNARAVAARMALDDTGIRRGEPVLAALGARAHDRGVRAPQRPRRLPPRTHRRRNRRLTSRRQ